MEELKGWAARGGCYLPRSRDVTCQHESEFAASQEGLPMRIKQTCLSIRFLAAILILSVTWMAVAQSQVEAMLVPSTASQAGDAAVHAADLQTIQTTLESKLIR